MAIDPNVRFIVWTEEYGRYFARADVLDHPYEYLIASASSPQAALRELVEVVIPNAMVVQEANCEWDTQN